MKKIFSKAFIFLVIAALLFMHLLPGFETRAYAATYNVSDFSGLTSAISSAVPGDTININANINVTSQITISGKSLTINGNGYTLSVPSPGVDDAGLISPTYSTWRVFNLSASGHTITLNNMKIKGGRPSSDGGAIFNASGTTLNLNYVTVSNSGGSDSYAAGGIQNQGTVYMKYCSILRNAARYGGGFLNSGTMYIENTTFSENRTLATNGGGGAGQNDGTLYINNSTFANNYSTELGSAVSNWSIMHVLNSTFTGNVSYHSSYNSGAINAKGSLNNIINCFFAYNYHTGDGNSYTLADFANFNSPSPNIYYTSYHQASLPANATTGGAIYKYNGAANGSNNDFSAGGATSRFLAANGTQLGTGTFFQPFLVYHNSALPAVIKLKSGSFAYGKATVTAFRTGASPIVAYQHPAGTWNYRVGSSSAGSYIVSTDQLDTSRGSGSASDALGSTVENAANLKMVKIRANTDGSVAGGSIYGDVYPAGTQVTLTAYPNSGKRFKQWNDANNTLVSTQNPYTFTLTDNIELAPVYETFAGYTVTYLGNGNTEGQAPPPSSRTSGQSETIASKNTLVKTGYTFGGWNTLPTGLGTTYQPGDSHNFGTNTLLYAKWVPVTPPSTPSAISAAAGNAHATVSFTAPASDGGSPITHYTVKVFQNGNEQAMLATTGSATAITVTGLTNGLPYTFKVFATNSAGNSPDSSMSNVVTPTAPPASPSTPTAILAAAGNSQAYVSFTPPSSNGGSPITHYTVKVFQNGIEQASLATTSSATTITVTGLTNGLPYTFKVFATNLIGHSPDSEMSNAVTPTADITAPSAPSAISATAGDTQATVSFTAPLSDGGSSITHYTVKVFQNGNEQPALATTGSATAITVTGLTNGLPYTFKVFATNSAGSGPDSDESNAVTPTVPVTPPSTPTAISAAAGNAQATVSFTAPASNGGSPITHYTVKVFKNGSEQPSLSTTGAATTI
ncbi:MAG: fibronectin type III domain-containing protein, partial [Clostridia bacterium]|nr:fibronectin type III domain-containing protein [Clostridia bacterium]